MLIVICLALGAFGSWFGQPVLKRLFGNTWSWVILGAIALLALVVLPLGLLGVLLLDGAGLYELHGRHKARQQLTAEATVPLPKTKDGNVV